MSLGTKVAETCMNQYRMVAILMVAVTLAVAVLAAVPSIYPQAVPFLNSLRVDTDPENMLSEDEPVRVFHDEMKEKMSLNDMVVVGIVNEKHPEGVFNVESLKRIYELTQYAKTLQWKYVDGKLVKLGETRDEQVPDEGFDPGLLSQLDEPTEETETQPAEDASEADQRQEQEIVGVVEVDLIAPSTVDNIEQGGLGVVQFEWLMPEPPETEEEALAIRDKALNIPFLAGTLVSDDGKAIALYLPLTSKDLSYLVSQELQTEIEKFGGDDEFHITGLPVAEDTFGVEMFVQMAISAPLAMLVIFILMLIFFHKLVLIISPMIVAMVSVILTMGSLIIAGFPVHIMSSMIPIFIMPIAVLDSVHFISEFFDRYQETKDRRKTIKSVLDELFMPMLYTSLTSSAGFASLALTPIPPVQVFGVFVAMGIMAAWLLTITFIPAYIMFISPKTLEKFGKAHEEHADEAASSGWLSLMLRRIGSGTYRQAKPILVVAMIVIVIAVYGISLIVINDNPVKWFTKSHPIRVADRVLNDHFAGTYMAYLSLSAPDQAYNAEVFVESFTKQADARKQELTGDLPEAAKAFDELKQLAAQRAEEADTRADVLKSLAETVNEKVDSAEGDMYYAWDEASLFLDEQRQSTQVFKDPEVMKYMEDLQKMLADTAVVGKSNSVVDLVKTVHRELFLGKPEEFRVPDTRQAIAQCLITYQNSHRASDLWHFVTPDYRTASMWVQLTSGDNRDMSKVVAAVNDYIAANPPPEGLEHKWFGLTYINVIWQDKMVSGMLQAFLGSFLVVFLLMTILFRSSLWGLLSMVPLTITIVAIYGAIGLFGKTYDMPVAVLSSLALGLAVDFAIHFLARSRRMHERHGSWEATVPNVFGEPARAIVRNIIVIATGFLPLLFAPLMPYKTVGALLATILLVSGIATLSLLPALMRLLEKWLFVERKPMGASCNCVTCLATSLAAVLLLAVNIHQYGHVGWTTLTWISLALIVVLALGCGMLSRRQQCKVENTE